MDSQSRIEWTNYNSDTVETIVSTRTLIEQEEYVQIDEFATVKNVPTKVSQLNNDAGYLTTVSWSDVQQKPDFVDETQLNGLRDDINSELNNKLNISDYNNTRLYSPTVEKFIDGDGKVWSNSGVPQQTDELAYKSDLGGIDTRIGQVESRTDGLTTTVNGISNRVDTYDSRIGQVETATNGLTTTVTGLTTTVNGVSNKVDTVESRIGQVDERVSGVEGSIETI